jgi:hypothetical protein
VNRDRNVTAEWWSSNPRRPISTAFERSGDRPEAGELDDVPLPGW